MGKSRSLLPQNVNTLSGSEAPSLHLSQPSNKCGSRSKNTTKLAHPLSTENASKQVRHRRNQLQLQQRNVFQVQPTAKEHLSLLKTWICVFFYCLACCNVYFKFCRFHLDVSVAV